MNMMQATRKQQGFTIIELVVVILLLGILAATALPRFMDVSDQAHTSVIDATQGGLQTGVALYHAQWTAEGQPADGVEPGIYTIGNLNGYPNAATDAECVSLYSGLLQAGAPSIVTGNTWATDPADPDTLDIDDTSDFNVFQFTAGAAAQEEFETDDEVCVFLYTAQADNLQRSLVYIAGTDTIIRYTSLEDLDTNIDTP